jgi:hypothetical protein
MMGNRQQMKKAPKYIATNKMALVPNNKPPIETSCANLSSLNGRDAIPRHHKHDGQRTANCERKWRRSKISPRQLNVTYIEEETQIPVPMLLSESKAEPFLWSYGISNARDLILWEMR